MTERSELAAPYLSRAADLRRAGRLAESLDPLRQAVALDPTNAFAFHDLGLTLFRCGRSLEAVQSLSRAVAIKPDFAAAYCRLGIAHAAANQPDQAIAALQQSIALEPGRTEAHAALAPLLLDRGQRRAAAAAYRRAGTLAGGAPAGQFNLARALVIEERDGEAETALRGVVARDPKNSAAHWMLGNLFSEAGRFDLAETEFAAAVTIDPRQAVAWYDLTRCRRLGAADRTWIERMETALPRLTRPDTIALMHLALGKACDDLGDPGAAMQHFNAGNAAKPDLYGFDRKRVSQGFDALIGRFTPELFSRHRSQASSFQQPVMILGLPRSGTTLVEQIVASHPAVHGGGELLFWEHQGRAFSGLSDEAMVPRAITRIAEEGMRVLRELNPEALRVTDKMPWNFRWAGLIHLVFPAARIIHCRRSPIDTCLSIFQTYFGPRPDFSTKADDIVFYHGEYERLMAHWRVVLPPDRFLEIEYEKLVAAPEQTSRQMIAFLGLEWDDACMHPERNLRRVKTASKWQARQPIYASALERWRRYEPFLGPFSALLPTSASDDAGNAAPTAAFQPDGASPSIFRRCDNEIAAQLDRGKAIEKASGERGGPISSGAAQPPLGAGRAGSVPDLIQRGEGGPSLESVFAKTSPYNLTIQSPGVSGFPFGAPQSAQVSEEAAREAHRCANEGARLASEARLEEAIALLQRSVQLNPTVAVPHHDLGLAMLAAGRLQEAAAPFAAALRLDPSIPTAHYCLGYISDNLGQHAKAMRDYQSAVALMPDLVEAQLRLGDLYLARGLRAESIAAFRAAAASASRTETARIAEARAHEVSGALEEAVASMRALVESHPADAEAHAVLGRLLGQIGLAAEAAAHYERAAELSPALSHAWSGVATNRKFTAADGSLIARMSAALARSDLTPRQRLLLHFALGKVHDDIGDYEAAMGNFEAGNRLRALGGRLRRDALAQQIDRLIETTPSGYRDGQPHQGVEDATPIPIAGMPRSGTTLIEQILSSHPEVAAGGELQFWAARAAQGADFWGITNAPGAARRVADDYLATLRALGPNAKRVTDKTIGVFMFLGVIHHVFPNATLIHCRRHPIDTALSIFTTSFERNFDFASDRSDLVFYVRQYQRLMAHWRKVMPADRFIEVDYEALVTDLEPEARRLIAACSLEWNDACLAPHRNMRKIETASLWQARQPVYHTSVERWRHYEPWLGELRELAP